MKARDKKLLGGFALVALGIFMLILPLTPAAAYLGLLEQDMLPPEPQLFEGCTTGDNSYTTVNGPNEVSQIFMPSVDHDLYFVRVKMFKIEAAGLVSINISATTSPPLRTLVETKLAAGTIDMSALSTDSSGAFADIPLNSPLPLDAGTYYSIVIASTARIGVRYSDANPYSRGIMEIVTIKPDGYITNSGPSPEPWDIMFQEYGVAHSSSPNPSPSESPMPTPTPAFPTPTPGVEPSPTPTAAPSTVVVSPKATLQVIGVLAAACGSILVVANIGDGKKRVARK